MKKFNLDPMSLDKETIALLDVKQLMEIVGGITANGAASQRCCGGGSGACTDATSTGCGTGGSTCVTNPNQ